MEIIKFVEKLAEQFDDTDAGIFTPETKFRELDEWSSLVALSVIAMVDDEFDVVLKGDEIRSVNTIEELYNLIRSKA